VIGALVHHRHGRLFLQLPLLAVAAIVVAHGLLGPQIAPRNLATVSVWIHYRGLLIVALLAVGNLFCTGCPMILARDTARRIAHPAWRWPRVLRTKWLAIVLLACVLFSYELFDLWDLPRATAWLIVAYFAAAIVVDTLFSGAVFCKYVCPIGQFNFVASTMSPTELRVKDTDTCRACRTADCIKGRAGVSVAGGPVAGGSKDPPQRKTEAASASPQGQAGFQTHQHAPYVEAGLQTRRDSPGAATGVQTRLPVLRGCELGLFLPLKVGNVDCTLCFDCVRACPQDNIALATRVPGDELADMRRRSGIGSLAQRVDLAALATVFTFGALVNAFAMTRPASGVEQWLAGVMGVHTEAPVLAALFVIGLVLLPTCLIGAASAVTGAIAGDRGRSIRTIAVRHAYALVPFGVGAWVAHYGFHLLTGVLTIVPVTQSALIDVAGWPMLGEPLWRWAGMRPGAVFPIQLGFLLLGAAGSLGLAGRMAARDYPDRATRACIPWMALIGLLAAAAIWILAQPMDMRGVGFGG
jgi:ferredoxin